MGRPGPAARSLVPIAILLCAGLLPAQEPAGERNDEAALKAQAGTWIAVSFRRDGKQTPAGIVRTITRTVEADHVVWKRDGKSFAGTKLVLGVQPSDGKDVKTIDVLPDGGPSKGKRVLGIYKQEGDELTLCMADPDKPRPTEFKAEPGSPQTLMVFRRQKDQP
ncbi:TIGR03067 domain-containing protein [Aquisphaera insulae]|uniref:TIGR03067 domain-containing protein n=1 Tax=Aquisphaera insulae TaxID=2712864 RepID=UPI0013EBC2DC|nr:TIGR03067 domain-containing protein [Aquisphaera insulae]